MAFTGSINAREHPAKRRRKRKQRISSPGPRPIPAAERRKLAQTRRGQDRRISKGRVVVTPKSTPASVDRVERERRRERAQRRGTSIRAREGGAAIKLAGKQVRQTNRAVARRTRTTFGPQPGALGSLGTMKRGGTAQGRALTAGPPALLSPEGVSRLTGAGKYVKGPSAFEKELALFIATAPLGGPVKNLAGLGVKALGAKLLGRGAGKALARAGGAVGRTRAGRVAGRIRLNRADRLARRGPVRQQAANLPVPLAASTGATEQGRRLPQIPIQTARALATSGSARENTATGAAKILAAILAAPATIPKEIISKGPKDAGEEFIQGAIDDYKRRYGPLLRGEKGAGPAFRKRLAEEGAAAELLDLTGTAAIGGATLGRAAGGLARGGALGSKLERAATRARPNLRISEGTQAVRRQDLSHNLFRALAQRGEDRLRVRNLEKRNTKALAGGKGKPGIQPRRGEVVRATKYLQGRGIRMATSDVSARGFNELRSRMRQYERSARANVAGLNAKQRRAFVMGLEGAPINSPAEFRLWAQKRQREIITERATKLQAAKQGLEQAEKKLASAKTDGQRERWQRAVTVRRARAKELQSTPGILRGKTEELRVLREIAKDPESILDDKFRQVVREESQRSNAADELNVAVAPSTAEARRLRLQGEMLGVPHHYTVARDQLKAAARKAAASTKDRAERARIMARRDEHLAELDRRKPDLDRQYARDVRAARGEIAGEPGFVTHRRRGAPAYSDRAPGSGNRAIAAPRMTNLKHYREGRRDVSPDAYFDTLARQVKYGVNWKTVSEQYRLHAKTDFTDDEIARATGKAPPKDGTPLIDTLTVEDLQRVIERRGEDPEGYGFVNPGILERQRGGGDEGMDAGEPIAQQGLESSPELRAGFEASAVDIDRLAAMGEARSAFMKTRGWYAVRKQAFDELDSATKPSGKAGRMVSKVVGFQSRMLLGTSPSWLPFQIAANAFVAGFGVRGNVFDVAESVRWWKSLTPEQQHEMNGLLGSGAMRGHGEKMYLGYTSGALAKQYQALMETPFMQRASRYNPLDLVFRADDAQNAFFRRAVLYSQVKRDAYARLGAKVPELRDMQGRLVNIMDLPPRERINRLLESPELVDAYARKVDEFLGNWQRFSTFERRVMKRGVLFYGFMRFATRMLFYTAPIKHPVVASIVAKLAQLHTEEVADLVGGREAPWAFSRIFFGSGDNLSSIDTLRANPVTSPMISALESGPRALTGLVSPLLVAALDQMADESHFTGIPYRVGGSTAGVGTPGAEKLPFFSGARARIFTDDMLSMYSPYRLGELLTQTGTQSDDSLLFSARPLQYSKPDAIARERQRIKAQGDTLDKLTQFVAPYVFPKRDTTPEIVRRRQQEAGKKGAGGSGKIGKIKLGGGSGVKIGKIKLGD